MRENMQEKIASQESIASGASRRDRLILFLVYLIGGLAVFVLGSNTFDLFSTNRNLLYEWSLTLALLVLALLMRQAKPLKGYWEVGFALFIASFANATNAYLGNWLARLLPLSISTAQEIAIDKLSQAIPIVLAIILVTWLSGNNLGSIFLKKGDLRWGLRFGFISFGVFAVIFAVIAVLQSSAPSSTGLTATGVGLDTIISAIPWILIFVFANAFMEELWFRGISLGKLRPFLGVAGSVFLTALVFGATHLGATYVTTAQMILFSVITFLLGLVNGCVMFKTNSIWGSVLFHAGYDLLVIIPVLVIS
jgi:membrane protease YdiL (CAAX protease family)